MNPNVQRLKTCCLATLVIATIQVPLSGQPTSLTKPNIVFILADDLGFSDIGCYGSEIQTPHLDALAANGLRYTQFYNTARCWPTRAALLTGYYAQQVRRDKLPGLGGGGRGKRPRWARLLPDFLKPLGYRSYHSGKWHIDGDVLASGFDRSLNMRNQGSFFTAAGNSIDDQPIVPSSDESGYYATDAVAEHAIACLTDHHQNHRDAPFFHFIAFIAPHFPLHAPAEEIDKYRDRYLSGWDVMRESRSRSQRDTGLLETTLSDLEPNIGPPYHFPDALEKLGPGEVNRPLPWSELTDQQKRFQATKMAIHAAMVDRMDQAIGRVVQQLHEMEQLDNTLIMFASDNGASAEIMVRHGGHDPRADPGSEATYLCLGPGFSSACNTPFRRHKTWVHEGGIATPLIVHWPKGIQNTGQIRTTVSHVIDFVPTVLEVVGSKKPEKWNDVSIPPAPGKSIVATFNDDVAVPRKSLWWLHEGNRAIRVDDWKLVAAKDEAWQLYDLASDRTETHDLASQHPNEVKRLSERWNSELQAMQELVASSADD